MKINISEISENISGNASPVSFNAEQTNSICLEPLDITFSVCKVTDYSEIDPDSPFVFIERTDQEKSLVCPADMVPSNIIEREDGWEAFRICGVPV